MAQLRHDVPFRYSIMTPLGLVEGDCLNRIEEENLSRLKDIVKDSAWPESLVLMGIGSLIRSRLVGGIQQGEDTYLYLNEAPARAATESASA